MSNVVNGSLTMIPVPQTSGLFVSGVFSDSTVFSVSVPKGSRVPLVTGSIYYGSAIFHADGLSVCIENAYAGLLNDLTGNFTVSYGEEVLFSGDLTIWAYTRTRPFWVSAPTLIGSPELWRLPTYGSGSGSAQFYTSRVGLSVGYSNLLNTHDPVHSQDNSPMGLGLFPWGFGQAGEHDNFGEFANWDAAWIVNPTANNLKVVRGMSDAIGVFPAVCIDPSTNLMIRATDYPKLTMQLYSGQIGVPGNPIAVYTTNIWNSPVGINFDQVQEHNTNACALACILWGTDYDKEALSLWTNYVCCLVVSWPYRDTASGFGMGVSSRGCARSLHSLTYAATVSDNTAYFTNWMNVFSSAINARYAAQTGIHIDQTNATNENYEGHGSYAPWQDHIFIGAIGSAIRNGFSGWQSAMDYLTVSVFQSLLDTPHEYACHYALAWRSGNGGPGNPIAPDFAHALQLEGTNWDVNNLGASLQYSENTIQLVGTDTDLFQILGGTMPRAQVGVPYSVRFTLDGYFTSGAVTVGSAVGAGLVAMPAWVQIAISGNSIYFYGTPTEGYATFLPTLADSGAITRRGVCNMNLTLNTYQLNGVISVKPLTAGTGYTNGDSVTFTDSSAPSAAGATAKITTNGLGGITGVIMQSGGGGYDSSVVASAPSGSGATFTITRAAAVSPVAQPTPGNSAVSTTLYLAGDFDNDPWSADGKGSNLQVAVAEAANYATDQTSSRASWTVLNAHIRSGIYAQSPKYNIVPT